MSKRVLLGTGVVFLLASCAVTPNPDAIGPYPSNFKESLKAHVLRTYFDPYSIRSVSVSEPIQGHLYFQQGWLVCLESNAKNRMGGYIGLQRTAYLFNRGSIVQTMDKAGLCDNAKLGYSPWPELEQMK